MGSALDRYYKEKKKTVNITGKSNALDRYHEEQRYNAMDTSFVDQAYIDSFINDVKTFLTTAEKDYGGVGWANASSSYDSKTAILKDLNTRSTTIRAWLFKNRTKIDKESYNGLVSNLDTIGTSLTSVLNSYKSAVDYYAQWDTEDAYNAQQELLNSEDFEHYSQIGANIENPTYSEAQGWIQIGAWRPFGEDIGNIVTFSRDNIDSITKAIGLSNSNADISNVLGDYRYQFMTDDEVAIYNYYLGKGDTEKAAEYLKSLDDTLNQRHAGDIVERVDGNPFLEIVFSAGAGLDQFASGIGNIDNLIKGTESDPNTVTQYAQSQMQANNEGLFKVANDLVYTTGNMLPSILVGSLTGGVGGALTLGTSAVGNGYAEMRNLGYNEWQARGYGLLVGASEATLQYFLGGISKLGGKVSGNAVTNLVSKIDNAFARTAIKLGGNMASEGLEEAIQTVLEPAFKALMTGEDFESPEWDEILYSGLLGALSAGLLEGGPTIAGTVSNSQNAKNVYGADSQALVSEALDIDPNNTYAQKMQAKLDKGKNLSGGQINRLVETNEQTLRSQDTAAYNKGLYDLANEVAGVTVDDGKKIVTDNTTAKEIVSEGKFKASEDGKAKVGDTEVSIKEIASVKDGEVMLRLEDGTTVNARDVELASADEGLLYENVVHMGLNAATANAFVNGYNPGMNVQDYILGFREAYRYGEHGFPVQEMSADGFSARLSESQKSLAYNLGKSDAKYKAEAKQKAKIASTSAVNVGKDSQKTSKKGKLYNTLKPTNETQRASLKALGVLAEALGIDIYTFESPTDAKGRRLGENGSYDPRTKTLRIDLYAGADGKGTMLFTAAHELTHHIRATLPTKFKAFADFLFEQYGEKGISVSKLIEHKRAFLEEKGRITPDMTEAEAYDLAYEEVVADACESFLADGDAVAKIAELKAKDKTLWQTIKDFLTNLVARIKAAYDGLSPDSVEGRLVAEMLDSAEKLKAMWTEALVEASEVSDLVDVDMDTESVSPKFSEKTWTESEYVIHRDQMAEKISKALGVTIKKAKSYIDDINSIAKMIADDRARLDYEASSFGSAFVSNVEYGGSFDYTTLCKKRRIYTGTFTEIQKRLKDVALTPDDILTIRNLMIEEGIEATCGLCYVEGSRANMGKFAKEFIRLYKRDNPNAWIPNMADVNTPDGVEQMRISHPEAYDQYVYFWNHYGKLKDSDKALFASQQKPKLYEARKEYKGEILEHFKGDTAVEKKNRNGGIRMQSFSDFEIVHLIDTMQVIMDMSTVGLTGQAYTKVPEFAMAFGNTGLKINLSLIAKGVDANGNLIFDDREGMPHKTAFDLRNKYSKNVGTIIVTFTDEQLLAAMADPRIDFIIPFHRSQWKKGQYGAMGLPKGTKDYTYMQNEKLIKQTYHEYRGRMVKDKASNYMPNEYWDFSKSGKENAEAYLKMCAENNKRPKFYKLLGYDGKGTYSLKADGSTDGYWKLLIDFKMYDNDGVGSPQMAVTPTFNMDEAMTMLDEYKGDHSKYPVASSVVDKFVDNYNKKHSTKYSDRDSNGNALSKEQIEFFKDSKVRDAKGNLLVVYHGTTANFNTFKKGDVGFHFGTNGAARGRVGFGKNVTVKEVYLNITNPIVFDEDLGSWDANFRLARELYDRGILTQEDAEFVLLTDDRQYRRTTEAANKKLTSVLLEKGYDGIAYSNTFETKKATTSYIVFNSNQAKLTSNKNPTESNDIRYSDRASYSPTFYSHMGKVIGEIRLDKMGANGVVSYLKGKGVKNEEIKWSGIETFLDGKKSVTKAELQEFVAGSQLQIVEQMSGEDIDLRYNGSERAYTIHDPSGNVVDTFTYNEFLDAYVAESDEEIYSNGIELQEALREEYGVPSAPKWEEYKLDGGSNYRELVFQLPNSTYSNRAMRVHWGDEAEGVLAHARIQDMTTADGKKMLFIEEIQSDWHNEGREKGYEKKLSQEENKRVSKLHIEEEKARAERNEIYREYRTLPVLGGDKYDALRERENTLNAKIKKIEDELWAIYGTERSGELELAHPSGIPDAPFRDTYHEYVLKRLLRMAAEEGYDSIGWTPAWIQSERWSEEYAEGYRIEYDQDIPKFLRKYGKKWGATVGKTDVGVAEHTINGEHYDAENIEVWSMSIPDSMKDSVLNEGQVLYSERSFASQVDAVLNGADTNSTHLKLMDTTSLLQEAGLPNLPILMTAKHLRTITSTSGKDKGNYHGLDVEIVKKLPDYISDPVIIADSLTREDSIVIITEAIDSENRPVIAAIMLNGVGQLDNKYVNANIMTSAYGKDNFQSFLDRIADSNSVIYWDEKKSQDLSVNLGVQFPNVITSLRSGVIIHQAKAFVNTKNEKTLRSDRPTDSFSNRSLLANALESVAQNDIERKKLEEYNGKISLIDSEQAKLADIRAEIKELSFAKGPRDTEAIKKLQFEEKQTANRINTYDRQLLNLESTKVLKGVLEREKQMAYKRAEKKGKEALEAYRERATKTQRELMTRYQESRKKGVEGRKKTEMRHKIRGVIKDLNKLLNHGTKARNVKEELKETVASSLKLAEVLFSNDIRNEDIVRLGVESVTENESKLLAEYSNLLDTIETLKEKRELLAGTEKVNETLLAKMGSVEEQIAKARNRISTLNGKLSNVFERERARLNRATVDKLVADLASEYLKLKDSESDYIRAAYDEYKYKRLDALKGSIGGTPVMDMSMEQLSELYDAYKMVAHFVRNANTAFKTQKGETITQMAEAANDQVRTVGGQPYKRNVISVGLQRVSWHLLKPYVAFRTIGSVTLTNLYKELRNGEDTFHNDVSEAIKFIKEQYEKHGYKSWDMKKTKTFTAKSGKSFNLTLEQMMTLYAYYRRGKAQEENGQKATAHKHVIEGGIVFEDSLIVKKNKVGVPMKYEVTTKNAFNLSEETFATIVNSLTAEQKAFVEEMQAYLSDTMGAKGNDVSMVLEGVKLFKEKAYFPIKSSEYYLNFSAEEAGEVKLKSPGFSKETTPHANNPIVLHNFTDLWSEHINDMAMYHSFVLALEDFTRVYNYKTRTDALVETIDTKATIETAYPGAKNYINKFLKDLNGGVRGETVGWAEKLTSLAKKGAVLGSASVAIQQPSAIMRAMAYINPIYFATTTHKSINLVKHNRDMDELIKYAPIAGIKKMGRFDIGVSKGTVDLIKSNKTKMDYVDDFIGLAPEFMDEITWVAIWNAVKRETAHNRKDLRPNSDEFLKVAGERVTDVISLSQVYDSVFSRSDLMRNKSLVAKWITSFMAEPTTTLNMLWDSWVQAKRSGSKKGFVKATSVTAGAVVSSIVLNSLLKSIVMAARDDDEDESYVEKYLEHFFGDLKDNLNPLTLIPVVKDVLSIFDGYDVERMDMSLVSDLKKAIDAFDNDNKTAYEKWSGLVGAISALFGVPVKNVERDTRAVINTIFGETESTTKAGIINAIVEGWTGESKSNGQQLYEAMLNGDTEQIARVEGRFKDQNAITSAIRKALKENDPRITEAAQAIVDGDFDKYTDLLNEIVGEGNFTKKDVKAAIDSKVNDITPDEEETESSSKNKEKSIYEMEYVYREILDGDTVMAHAMREDIIRTHEANGKSREEAEADFNSRFASYIREQYEDGYISDNEARNMLVQYGGRTEEGAASKIQYWDFKKKYPDYDLSEEAVSKYYEKVEPYGINISTYYDYTKRRAKCKGVDSNGDGKTDSGSVKREVLDVINSLPLSNAQKDALYYLNGWSASTIWEAPWH